MMNFFLGIAGVIFCISICFFKERVISWKAVLLRQIFSFLAAFCGIYVICIGIYNIGDTFDFITDVAGGVESIFQERDASYESQSGKIKNNSEKNINKSINKIDNISPKGWVVLFSIGAIIAIFECLWQPVVLLFGLGSIIAGVEIWKAVRADEELVQGKHRRPLHQSPSRRDRKHE